MFKFSICLMLFFVSVAISNVFGVWKGVYSVIEALLILLTVPVSIIGLVWRKYRDVVDEEVGERRPASAGERENNPGDYWIIGNVSGYDGNVRTPCVDPSGLGIDQEIVASPSL